MAETACARLERYRARVEEIELGLAAREVGFGEDRVSFWRAELDRLDRRIRQLEPLCEREQGKTPRRTRFAMGARFRPH